MRILARIYLYILFFLFAFILSVNQFSFAELTSKDNDFGVQYAVCESCDIESYIALSSKNNDNGIAPESHTSETTEFHTENIFRTKLIEEKTHVNIIALLLKTEIFPQAP